jgi:predicted nucleic acid-binding protein
MTAKIIRTYLDTGVLIRAFQVGAKNKDRASDIICDSGREFVVSDVLKLELIPKAFFHKQEEEVAFYEAFFKKAAYQVEISPALVAKAIELASKYDLAPCDALHLSAAIEAQVDEFITTEKPTKPFFRVQLLDLQIISLYVPPSKSDKSQK